MPELGTEQINGRSFTEPVETESPEQSSGEGEWVRKPEAATRLGISERMVEKRVAQGKLRKRVRIDGVTEVWVARSPEDSSVQKAIELVERYNHSLALQLVPVMQQNQSLIEKVAAQAEEIGRLKAKVDELEKGSEIQAKPWWRFW